MSDEDKLAAEWEAMAAADEPDGDESAATFAGTDRALNQDELDSLLGFSNEGEGGRELSGVHAIVTSALVSYERLPLLAVVFDRLVRMLSTRHNGRASRRDRMC